MLRSNWLSYYWAICYSPLTSSESVGFLAAKKGLKSSFNQLNLFCLHVFDQLLGFY